MHGTWTEFIQSETSWKQHCIGRNDYIQITSLLCSWSRAQYNARSLTYQIHCKQAQNSKKYRFSAFKGAILLIYATLKQSCFVSFSFILSPVVTNPKKLSFQCFILSLKDSWKWLHINSSMDHSFHIFTFVWLKVVSRKLKINLSASCDHFVTYKVTRETLDHWKKPP